MKTLDYYIKHHNMAKIEDVIAKWTPLFEKASSIKNPYILERLALFCEVESLNEAEHYVSSLPSNSVSKYNDISFLSIKLETIFDKINNSLFNEDNNLVITKSFYNVITNKLRHELEDGTILEMDNETPNVIEVSDRFCNKLNFLLDNVINMNLYQTVMGYTFEKLDDEFLKTKLENMIKKSYRKDRIDKIL